MSNLLKDASILLTPTGYDNGRMNAIKPYKDLYGPELIVNGDFSSGTSPFQAYQCNIANVNNTLVATATTANDSRVKQAITTVAGKKYKITADLLSLSGSKVGVNNHDGNTFSYGVNDVDERTTSGKFVLYFVAQSTTTSIIFKMFGASIGESFSIDNVSVVEDLSGDFTFSRNSAATRVNAQGLVENVQILSPELVSNGDFSQIGTEEVLNGNFSQEGSELTPAVDFGTSDFEANPSSGSVSESNGTLTFNNSSSNGTQIQLKNRSISDNKIYKITYTLSNFTSGNFRISVGNQTTDSINYNDAGAEGTHTFYLTKTSGLNRNYFYTDDSTLTVSNISVKEVGQDWDLQTGWSIGDGVANYDATSTGAELRQLMSSIAVGKTIKIQFDISDVAATKDAFFKLDCSGAPESIFGYTKFSQGTYTYYHTITSGFDRLTFTALNSSTGGAFSITNISVKEVGQDWQLGGGWSIGDGEATATSSANGQRLGQYILTPTVGKTYKVTYEIKSITQGAFRVWLGGVLTSTDNTDVGVYTFSITATDASTFYIRTVGVTSGSVANISVKEITDDTDIPRIDYTDGCGSWLLEPQSTNLLPYSEDFSDSSWLNSGLSINNNVSVSPEGVSNATKIIATTANSRHELKTNLATANGTDMVSCFVKKSGYNYVQIASWADPSNYVNFDLTNGSVGSIGAVPPTSYGIKDYGNGWYRIYANVQASGGGIIGIGIVTSASASWAQSFIGNGTDGIEIWGAQLEQQSYATSYIPTNGATNTRLQDIATNSGNASLINSTEGVLYAEISALANDGTDRFISISDNTNNNILRLQYITTDNSINSQYKVGGVTQASLTASLNSLDFNKIAVKYKENDFSLWTNGVKVATDNSGAVNSPGTFTEVEFTRGGNALPFYGKTKALAVYKEALTDANLRCLTYPPAVATTFDLDFDTIANDFTFTRGSEATFVNEQGLIESTASNDAPRIDYSTGTKAFLLEPQSTNYSTNSEQPSTWHSSGGVTITANAATSPEGIQNSSLVVTNASSGERYARNGFVFPSGSGLQTVTTSFFIKYYNNQWVRVRSIYFTGSPANGKGTYFDIQNGVIGTSDATHTAKMEDYGNGWYRCSITFDIDKSVDSGGYGHVEAMVGDNLNTFAAIGQGYYAYGSQGEEFSYPTSYIPSGAAYTTRNQELCLDATPVINSTEGTLYAEISALADNTTNNRISLSYDNQNFVRIAINNLQINFSVFNNGAYQANMNYTVSNITDFNKIAVKYKENDFALWINGTEVLTDTSGLTSFSSPLDHINFSNANGGGSFFYGNTKGLKYYPKALADVQLEDLTTITLDTIFGSTFDITFN